MSWMPGDPAPTRPKRGEPDYARRLERYADELTDMLIYMAKEFARFPSHVAQALENARDDR